MLTLATVAARLACSERTVRREIAAGRIAAVRIRGLLRVTESALTAYIDALPRETPCPSADSPTADIRSESQSLAANVLSARCPPELPVPTRGRSKMHYSAARSTFRQVERQRD